MADQDRPRKPETELPPIRHTGVSDLTTLTYNVDTAAALPVDHEATVATAFALHHRELYSFLVRATRDRESAEDLLQDAYLRLHAELRAGRTPANVRAWLYRVASNLTIDRSRRRSSVLRYLSGQARELEASRTIDSPETDYVRRERRGELEKALATLAPEARTALLLSSQGFSGEEIAAAIGRSHGATRTLLLRARRRVRSELDQQRVEA
jgi:RNA polymerase sigma-70 factor (ECF subfamily)